MATDPNRERMTASDNPEADERSGLTAKAERCRRLAAGISDRQAADVLSQMAKNYQDAADRADRQD